MSLNFLQAKCKSISNSTYFLNPPLLGLSLVVKNASDLGRLEFDTQTSRTKAVTGIVCLTYYHVSQIGFIFLILDFQNLIYPKVFCLAVTTAVI